MHNEFIFCTKQVAQFTNIIVKIPSNTDSIQTSNYTHFRNKTFNYNHLCEQRKIKLMVWIKWLWSP